MEGPFQKRQFMKKFSKVVEAKRNSLNASAPSKKTMKNKRQKQRKRQATKKTRQSSDSSSDSESSSERSFGNMERATGSRTRQHAITKHKHDDSTRTMDARIPRKKRKTQKNPRLKIARKKKRVIEESTDSENEGEDPFLESTSKKKLQVRFASLGEPSSEIEVSSDEDE